MTSAKNKRSRSVCAYSLYRGGTPEIINGYILSSETGLIKIVKIHDWAFSGVVIFRSGDAEEQDCDDDMLFFRKVLEANPPKIEDIPGEIVEASSFRDIFEWSMHNSRLIAIEGHEEFEFEIVKVHGVSDGGAIVSILESDGNWAKENDRITYSALVSITVLDPYCVGIERYFESCCGN